MAKTKEVKEIVVEETTSFNDAKKPSKKKLTSKELKEKKEKRMKKFASEVEASAKKKEIKQMDANKKRKETKQVPEKEKLAQKTPFAYYYNVSKDAYNNIVYCNIYQLMNDKKLGKIYQPQYFELAEQSSRIFEINELLIKHAIGICLLLPEIKFVVQVSPRYLETKELTKKLELLLENAPSNLIISLNARPLVITGTPGKRRLESLVKKYKLTLMLDQLETERTSLLFEFPIKYARVDLRYYQEKDVSKTTFIKFMSDYCKSQNITLCARYVNSKEQRTWVFANGIKYIEGDIVQKIKNTVLGAVDIEN